MTTMAIWISLTVVLCLIHGHDSANNKIGCAKAVKVITSNGIHVYTCQAQNKDNDITWIINGERMQNVLATCLDGSTTCLTTYFFLNASRTETGRSYLLIVGSIRDNDIKCLESSQSKEVTCLQSTTAVTTTTGPGIQSSDSNPTSTKTTITGVSTQIFTTDERTEQPFSAVSTVFDRVNELSSQNNITKVSAHGDITESQVYVSTEIIGEETSSGRVNLTTASTTTVSPVTDSTQTLVLEVSHISTISEISPQTSTSGSTMSSLRVSSEKFLTSEGSQTPTAVTATTGPGNQNSDSNPTSTKTTITGVSTQILTTDERTEQPSSAVSTVFDMVTELSSQNNITEVSAHGDITKSQVYVSTEIIGEETSSGGVNLTTARTTTVSPVTDSTQTLVLEVSHIIKNSEISPQTNTLGSTMSSLRGSPEKILTSKDVNTANPEVLTPTTVTLTQKKDDQSYRDLLVAALAVTCITLVVICLAAAIFIAYYKTQKRTTKVSPEIA